LTAQLLALLAAGPLLESAVLFDLMDNLLNCCRGNCLAVLA
jgi:hypothetical protein